MSPRGTSGSSTSDKSIIFPIVIVAGIITLVVGLVIAVILLVGVLTPITQDVIDTTGDSNTMFGASGQICNNSVHNWSGCADAFTGVNGTISGSLITFVLIGVLVLIAGVAIYGIANRG
jgi:hypothetical protein